MTEDNSLAAALAGCQEDRVKASIRQQLDAGVAPTDIVAQCNQGMVTLGERFAAEECFLPDLMFGGMIMKSIMAELEPLLEKQQQGEPVATAVMGAVQNDVHDIGKDIVIMMLRGIGFEVVDLGIDVSPAKFVEAITQHKPNVVGMSVLLTTCYTAVGATVDAIREAGLRDGLSLMVGGAAASPLLSEKTGCDFYGKTAVDGVRFAEQLVGLK